MPLIPYIINKKLNSIENTFYLIEESLADHVGPFGDSKKITLTDTLSKSYYYLYRDDIFSFGLLQLFPSSVRKNILKKHPELQSLYQKLRDCYIIPYPKLKTYLEHLEQNSINTLNKLKREIEHFYNQMSIFSREYIDFNTILSIKGTLAPLFAQISQLNREDLFSDFLLYFRDIDNQIDILNKAYIERELLASYALLSDIDGRNLDRQQRLAVITHDTHSLVVAGAGSGKTTVLAAKVKYLVDVKKMDPKNILLLTFTRKAADEMKYRVSEKLNINVDVKTFHGLGLGIISRKNGYKSDICDDPSVIINEYFTKDVLDNSEVVDAIIEYLSYYLRIPVLDEDIKTLGEILEESGGFDNETIRGKLAENQDALDEIEIDELKRKRLTIKKEKVKSMEEVQIANFLYLNGIEYEYERPYEIYTRTVDYRQYKPDFYLPDYGIYIEHFGMNRDHRVPYLTVTEEAKYIDSYHWKLSIHAENETKLITTYSYYNREGTLINKLKEQLESHGVKFYTRDKVELYKKLYLNNRDSYFEELVKLISTFVSLLKSNKYNQDDIDRFMDDAEKTKDEYMMERTLCFLEIVYHVFYYYEQKLKEKDLVDFNDMLNHATDIVDSGAPIPPYEMIIVDEFQDTSMSRYRLVQSLLKRTQAKLLSVGDDWQSIYRFAGSDLKVFTDFEEFFGSKHLLRIENTYRNPQKLIDIAGDFIMKNPAQFKKNLKSVVHTDDVPITIIGYDSSPVDGLKKAIDETVLRRPDVHDILLIGRNNRDINFLKEYGDFRVKHNEKDKTCIITYSKYPNIKFNFLTAHRSKGLEAEVTILLNVNNSLVGFPNKIADDPILSYVLTDKDEFSFSEERRLFYVALTRTKSFTYILTRHVLQSVFVAELIENYKVPYIYLKDPEYINHVLKCPACITGHLVKREGPYSEFISCTNFKYGCTFKTKHIEILKDPIQCPGCGNYMIKSQRFETYTKYACIEKEYCNYTINIRDSK